MTLREGDDDIDQGKPPLRLGGIADDRNEPAAEGCPTCRFPFDAAVPAVGMSENGWPIPCSDPFHVGEGA